MRNRTYPEPIFVPALVTTYPTQFISPGSGWSFCRSIESCSNASSQSSELWIHLQSDLILYIYYSAKTGGFFVECGAFDGEFGSNTLFMERNLQWKGILIEPDQKSFNKLLTKNRHSWALPVCLATEPYPTKVCNSLTHIRNKISQPL